MASYILYAVLAWIAYSSVTSLIALRTNIAKAKASGLQYHVVPVYIFNNMWMIFSTPTLKVLRLLPKKYTHPWLQFISPQSSWANLYALNDSMGTDTYLTISPGRIKLWTADPEVITQMTNRRNDFPKPIHVYRTIDIYGKNIVTTEGQEWRKHRKIAAPPFGERNNHMVWEESIHQAQLMVTSWTGVDGNESRTINTMADDTMRLSLHIISRAGFGKRLLWPGVEDEQIQSDGDATGKGPGHTMTYTNALGTLLHSLITIVAVPRPLLVNLPFKKTRAAYESFVEWGKYMEEMAQEKKSQIGAKGTEGGSVDLMGALLEGAGYTANSGSEKGGKPLLTDAEILGNAFVFILAGHETTANLIHFALILLAMNLESQRHLQADVQTIFGDRPTSEWQYDRDMPKLFGGMCGAVMNEELRLIPPVANIPKSTITDQPINIEGKKCTVPGGTYISLVTTAAHRNPKYWPTGPPRDPSKPEHPFSNTTNDLEEFKPERWLLSDSATEKAEMPSDAATKTNDSDALGVNTAADTAASLFKPVKGSYLPFSEGYRSCIGRRFAQVEAMAVLAVIMQQWSVELAVDQFATDEEVARMTQSQKKDVWMQARDEARRTFREGMGTIITLQFRGGNKIPLRFVKRGKERFNF